MDYITSAVEVVVGSFFLGAVMGAIVALHLQTRRDPKTIDLPVARELEEVKVKVKR